MLDDACRHLGAKFLLRHSCPDFFLQRQSSACGINYTTDAYLTDLLTGSPQGEHQLVHGKPRIHACSQQRNAVLAGSSIQLL